MPDGIDVFMRVALVVELLGVLRADC